MLPLIPNKRKFELQLNLCLWGMGSHVPPQLALTQVKIHVYMLYILEGKQVGIHPNYFVLQWSRSIQHYGLCQHAASPFKILPHIPTTIPTKSKYRIYS